MKPAFKEPQLIPIRLRDLPEAEAPSRGWRECGGPKAAVDARPIERETSVAALVRENRFIQRMLDDRDRQFASLQGELSSMRRDWAWRTLGVLRLEVRRFRRQFWQVAPGDGDARRNLSRPSGRGTAA
jgi:hypothetical protein